MKKQLFSLYDVKSEFFLPPVCYFNVDDAQRGVASLFDSDNKFSKYPEDYKLYRLGIFDDSSGLIDPENPAGYICDLVSLNPRPAVVPPNINLPEGD